MFASSVSHSGTIAERPHNGGVTVRRCGSRLLRPTVLPLYSTVCETLYCRFLLCDEAGSAVTINLGHDNPLTHFFLPFADLRLGGSSHLRFIRITQKPSAAVPSNCHSCSAGPCKTTHVPTESTGSSSPNEPRGGEASGSESYGKLRMRSSAALNEAVSVTKSCSLCWRR